MDGTVDVGAAEGFCARTANAWQIVGYVLLIFKIVVPILVIIYGMIDLGKAVVASKDDEIKKAAKSLAFRAGAAIAIFLVPTIVGLVIGMIGNFSNAKEDYEVCRGCITEPNNTTCAGYAETAWNGGNN